MSYCVGGIPGISKARAPRPFARLSDGTLVLSSTKSASRIFENAVRKPRTYREAKFSNRYLIITEDQVHFLCPTMSASEYFYHTSIWYIPDV